MGILSRIKAPALDPIGQGDDDPYSPANCMRRTPRLDHIAGRMSGRADKEAGFLPQGSGTVSPYGRGYDKGYAEAKAGRRPT